MDLFKVPLHRPLLPARPLHLFACMAGKAVLTDGVKLHFFILKADIAGVIIRVVLFVISVVVDGSHVGGGTDHQQLGVVLLHLVLAVVVVLLSVCVAVLLLFALFLFNVDIVERHLLLIVNVRLPHRQPILVIILRSLIVITLTVLLFLQLFLNVKVLLLRTHSLQTVLLDLVVLSVLVIVLVILILLVFFILLIHLVQLQLLSLQI